MNPLDTALAWLDEDSVLGIPREEARNKLLQYALLVQEWNAVASLVSARTAENELDGHIADSLSLANFVRRNGHSHRVTDIGSGGGFPAIPLATVLPAVQFSLIERSSKKVGFLQKASASLGLQNVTITHGSFPALPLALDSTTVTARAVERPEVLVPQILESLRPGVTFLCQSLDPAPLLTPTWHSSPVHDRWTERQLRRGLLFLVESTS